MKKIIFTISLLILIIFSLGCTNLNGNAIKDSSSKEPLVVMLGVDRTGYTPNEIILEKGRPTIFKNDGSLAGCANYAVQPELGINANFAKNPEYSFTPNKEGEFIFTCSMGMVPGKIIVR
ncbi:cupredoxin domain-containing protein [Candidatus Woesearchaeota archaeon]|nr:cupredoxin domain-containing protein [Candidatus Woesearchaeota archaeon]